MHIYICNSYTTMARRDLPDTYALAWGPQAWGHRHIYQANHGISNIYHLGVLTKTFIGPVGSLPSEFWLWDLNS